MWVNPCLHTINWRSDSRCWEDLCVTNNFSCACQAWCHCMYVQVLHAFTYIVYTSSAHQLNVSYILYNDYTAVWKLSVFSTKNGCMKISTTYAVMVLYMLFVWIQWHWGCTPTRNTKCGRIFLSMRHGQLRVNGLFMCWSICLRKLYKNNLVSCKNASQLSSSDHYHFWI